VFKRKFFIIIIILGIGVFLFSCKNSDEFTIYFDSNGGTEISPIKTNGQTIVSIPNNPTKEGFVFGGWYNDSSFTGEPISSIEVGTFSNMSFYAKWEINQYSLTFETNGGSLVNPITANYDAPLSQPMVNKEGYVFEGWYSNPELTSTFTWTNMPAENMTLYAKWKVGQFTIDYYECVFDRIGNIQLSDGETIVSTSLGGGHSSALTSNGRLFTWGLNNNGQLGDGTTTNKFTPTEITSHFNLISGEMIVASSLGEEHSSAITSEGRIFTWGNNNYGQLGDGTTTTRLTPTDITSLFNLSVGETITSISLGYAHSSAITSKGFIFTWGNNSYGQLGDGTNIDRMTPIDITRFFRSPGEDIISVSLGYYHSSAITMVGRIFTWGWNAFGQLGDGTTINQSSPTNIGTKFNFFWDENITHISLGNTHSSALTSYGRIFTWGDNNNGQLGDGTNIQRTAPIEITNRFTLIEGEEIAIISLGNSYFSSALTTNGRLFTWGSNNSGQLGDGTAISKSAPINIKNGFVLSEGEVIVSISLGGGYSSFLTSTGHLFMWGNNGAGQLGDESDSKYTPTRISSATATLLHSESYEYTSTINEYIPYREGYIFDGWYTDSSLTSLFIYGIMPANNISLYGKWK